MTNIQIMKKALHVSVIKELCDKGFTGKWPHFRREHEGYIELLSFQINKWGGSFTVELSAVFPLSKINTVLVSVSKEILYSVKHSCSIVYSTVGLSGTFFGILPIR